MGETDNPLHRIITKCWEDEAFKERLLADPAATLAAEGVDVPEGIAVNAAVDAEDVHTLVIPLPPIGSLSAGELTAMAGVWIGCSNCDAMDGGRSVGNGTVIPARGVDIWIGRGRGVHGGCARRIGEQGAPGPGAGCR